MNVTEIFTKIYMNEFYEDDIGEFDKIFNDKNIFELNNNNESLLHIASLCARSKIVTHLLNLGLNPKLLDINKRTPLYYTIKTFDRISLNFYTEYIRDEDILLLKPSILQSHYNDMIQKMLYNSFDRIFNKTLILMICSRCLDDIFIERLYNEKNFTLDVSNMNLLSLMHLNDRYINTTCFRRDNNYEEFMKNNEDDIRKINEM